MTQVDNYEYERLTEEDRLFPPAAAAEPEVEPAPSAETPSSIRRRRGLAPERRRVNEDRRDVLEIAGFMIGASVLAGLVGKFLGRRGSGITVLDQPAPPKPAAEKPGPETMKNRVAASAQDLAGWVVGLSQTRQSGQTVPHARADGSAGFMTTLAGPVYGGRVRLESQVGSKLDGDAPVPDPVAVDFLRLERFGSEPAPDFSAVLQRGTGDHWNMWVRERGKPEIIGSTGAREGRQGYLPPDTWEQALQAVGARVLNPAMTLN